MADQKISDLTAVVTAAASDEYVVNQAGTTKKVTLAQALTSPTILGAAKFDDAANATLIEIDNDGTGHGIYLHQDGITATTKHAIYVNGTAANVAADAALVKLHQNNAGSSEPSLEVVNDGTGEGILIDQNGSGEALKIENAGTLNGITIQQAGVLASSKNAIRVTTQAAQTTSPLVEFRANIAGMTQPVLKVTQDDATTSTSVVLSVQNDGTGNGLYIDQNGVGTALNIDNSAAAAPGVVINESSNGTHLRLTGDPTVASPVDGDIWFDGTNLKMRIGETTYNIDMTGE